MKLPTLMPAAIAVALIVTGCSFSVKKPDTFSSVDVETEEVAADIARPEDVPADVAPECGSDEQCVDLHGPAPECLERYCKDGGVCGVKSAPPGTPCGEPDECGVVAACAAGKCEPGDASDPCDDDDVCTNDECVPGEGCQYEEIECVDNDPCTEDFCKPGEGCVHQTKPDCPPKCIETGEQYYGFQHDETCCSGVTSAALYKATDDTVPCTPGEECPPPCEEIEDVWVCTDCHDGVCDWWEDFCLCPNDCNVVVPPDNECVMQGGICEPAVPVPEELACPEGWQIDQNYNCDEDQWCCMPGPPPGCACPDDSFNFCGPDDECYPCFAELCDDGWDSDCDGSTDENNCFSSDALLNCLEQVAGEPTKISVHKLVHFPDAFSSEEIVTAGRAVAKNCTLLGENPGCDLYLHNKQGEAIPLTGDYMGMDVGCLPDAEGSAGMCHPLTLQKKYFVWGKWTTSDDGSGNALYVGGFCGE